MKYLTLLLFLFLGSCTTNFYVVRHAEKSSYPKENPELTEEGKDRAERLRVILLRKKLKRCIQPTPPVQLIPQSL